jgi:hypothetical protein
MTVKAVQALTILFIACTLCIPAAAASTVSLEYYHMDRCPDCELTGPLIADLESAYDGVLVIEWIDVETVEGWERWNAYEFLEVSAVVVGGTFKIPKEEITENIRAANEQSLAPAGAEPQENSPPINWDIPFAYSLGLFFRVFTLPDGNTRVHPDLRHRVGQRAEKQSPELGDIRPRAGFRVYRHGVLLPAGGDVPRRFRSVPCRYGGTDHDPRRGEPARVDTAPGLHRQLCPVLSVEARDHPCRLVRSGHGVLDRQGSVCRTDASCPAEQNPDRRRRAGFITPAGLRGRGAHAVSRRRGPRGICLVKQDTGIQGRHSSRKRDSVDRIWSLDAFMVINGAPDPGDARPSGSVGTWFCISFHRFPTANEQSTGKSYSLRPDQGVYNGRLPG